MGLAELELVELLRLRERDPHGVEAGEEPASPAALLVGHGLGLVNLVGEDMGGGALDGSAADCGLQRVGLAHLRMITDLTKEN